MPRKNSSAICLFSAVAGLALSAVGAPLPLDVMPAPAEVTIGAGRVPVAERLVVDMGSAPDHRLAAVVVRAQARWLTLASQKSPAEGGLSSYRLLIRCSGPGSSTPTLGEDESYTLEIGASQAVLNAATPTGALHGLETLIQLPRRDSNGWYLTPARIADKPRFPWRGLMIDVARHWQPVEVIKRNLDAMAVVKLNVLHLHLSDDQGFRIESRTHPELQGMGSDGLYFTQEQMRSIITYAADRGIRVVPEFDVPGHATSWVVSHPELASLPGPYSIERHWGVFNPVLDPTNEATYALLADFLGEMSALFPDRFIHIGGDENNGVQWNANPRIQTFIREHGLKDNAGLHAYFNKRIGAILAKSGKRIIGWDEIMNPELPRDCVIDSWRGTEALASAAALGFDGILSNGFYIDLCYSAAEHYSPDPLPASSKLTNSDCAHVLGGEATMWSEWVTPETIDSRIWPRTAAIAERLWSQPDVRDAPEMYRRLAIVSDRLSEAGSLHQRNTDMMLRYLVGANLEAPGISSLRTLISIIEPVKHYDRGGLQVWGNQLVPLIELADAAKPESEVSRQFRVAVERVVFAPGGIDRASATALADSLAQWEKDGSEVANTLPDIYPGVREAIPVARGLVSASAAGADAVESIREGKPLEEERLSIERARLDQAAQPNESATLLPIIAPIRLLVAAAARQGERPGLTDAQWRALLLSTTPPATPVATQ